MDCLKLQLTIALIYFIVYMFKIFYNQSSCQATPIDKPQMAFIVCGIINAIVLVHSASRVTFNARRVYRPYTRAYT